ncbi:auxin transporter protein 1 isoform X1 [Selaginella moellendorffii]|uniref:auxin transporter protein 1 isoform X1 n=2 Tax=Selaginella moellendorffii TaxID=88036 RepID=UPI000D1CF980|nr:auxin transporter protein 1 isoform X1 [Selaginella moellendorffii]|eukprot:XP_024519545.1 auxin transporter protein 1 isoform X1 [Selaginella moellendorffii]
MWGHSRRLTRIASTILNGSSVIDAWFNATSYQVGQVLLTLPNSFAQLGLVSGILFQLLYGTLGAWACYMTTWLYMNYRKRFEREALYNDKHEIQWYEVLDGLLGTFWKYLGLIFNTGLQVLQSAITLIGASNLAHILNDRLDKRSWTLVLGACVIPSILIPRAQNYRVLSSVGIVMTTYTAWYMVLASIFQGKDGPVKHSAPHSSLDYFLGASNILYAFGGHGLTIELTHAMKKPQKFKEIYLYAVLYIWTLTLPSAIAVYWTYGEEMLHHSYALTRFHKSKYRDVAIILMIIHQFVQFGFSVLPIYLTWEKFCGIHSLPGRYLLKSAARLPVVILVWLVALMIPFIGVINIVAAAFFTSFTIYIVPCVAFMVYHRSTSARKESKEGPPFWLPSWIWIYAINVGVVVWILVIGVGFGAWAGVRNLRRKFHLFGFFTRCYEC